MSRLSKDAYFGKALYAAKRNAANREIGTLTEEQCELLEDLCRHRHDMHTSGDSWYYGESVSYSRQYDFISSLYSELKRVGLPAITLGIDIDDMPTSEDRYQETGIFDGVDEDADLDELEQENRLLHSELMEKLNNNIESYLLMIDEKYRTSYCPTGLTRL